MAGAQRVTYGSQASPWTRAGTQSMFNRAGDQVRGLIRTAGPVRQAHLYGSVRPGYASGRSRSGAQRFVTGRLNAAGGRAVVADAMLTALRALADDLRVVNEYDYTGGEAAHAFFRFDAEFIDQNGVRQYRTINLAGTDIDPGPNPLPDSVADVQRGHLLAALNDNLVGGGVGSDPTDDPSITSVSNYTITGVSAGVVLPRAGGCKTNRRVGRAVPMVDAAQPSYFEVTDPASSNNNCGIQCMLESFYESGRVIPAGCNHAWRIRAALGIPAGSVLTFDDLDKVAARLDVSYAVYDERGTVVHARRRVGSTHLVELLVIGAHYSLKTGFVGLCGACGQPATRMHACANASVRCPDCHCFVRSLDEHRCQWAPMIAEQRRRSGVQRALEDEIRREEFRRRRAANESAIEGNATEEDTPECRRVLSEIFVKRSSIVLVTGQGGTGKTHVAIRRVREHHKRLVEDISNEAFTSEASLALLASTGCAASLIEGATTVHNYCGIGRAVGSGDEWASSVLMRARSDERGARARAVVRRLQEVEIMVVDEVSMLSGRFFDELDAFLRIVRGKDYAAFGGVQMVLVGDPCQLPPVSDSGDEHRDFFFDAAALRAGSIHREVLTQPLRFPSLEWFGLLGRARVGALTARDVRQLQSRVVAQEVVEGWNAVPGATPKLFLASTKRVVQEYNRRQLLRLPGACRVFRARDAGAMSEDVREALAPTEVALKVGCVVMLTVNHGDSVSYLDDYGVGNGSRGRVTGVEDDAALVEFFGAPADLGPVRIGMHDFNDEVVVSGVRGSRRQLPLVVAWALTIHKAQGATISDDCVLSLGNLFEFGMLYVALSRVVDISKVWIVDFTSVYRVNQRCVDWLEKPMGVLENVGVVLDGLGNYVSNTSVEVSTAGGQNLFCKRITKNKTSVAASMIDQKTVIFDVKCDCPSDVGREGFLRVWRVDVLHLRAGCPAETRVFTSMVEFVRWLFLVVDRDCSEYARVQGDKNSKTKAWLRLPYQLAAVEADVRAGQFLLQTLFEVGFGEQYRTDQVFKGSKLCFFSMRDQALRKRALVLHDVCAVLNCDFETACASYLSPESEPTTVFPWRGLSHCSDGRAWVAETRALRREDFGVRELARMDALTPDALEELLADSFSVPGACTPSVERREVWEEILDVDVAQGFARWGARVHRIRRLYVAVDEVLDDYLDGVSVLHFHTANALSKYGLFVNLPAAAKFSAADRPGKIDTLIYRLKGDMETFAREAVLGAKTVVNQDYFCSADARAGKVVDMSDPLWHEKTDALVYLDCRGFYAAAMLGVDHPYGEPYWGSADDIATIEAIVADESRWPELLKMKFIVRVDYFGDLHDPDPSFGWRDEERGAIVWDVGAKKDAVMTSTDMHTVLTTRGRVTNVRTPLLWPRQGKIYDPWLGKCLRLKNEGEAEGNGAKRSLGKLLANTLYGSTLQAGGTQVAQLCFTSEEVQRFFSEVQWRGMYAHGKGVCLWGEQRIAEGENVSASGMGGVFTLAESRRLRRRMFDAVLGDERYSAGGGPGLAGLYYQDTDSIVCAAPLLGRLRSAGVVGSELGKYACDLTGSATRPALVTRFCAMAGKCYALEASLPKRAARGSTSPPRSPRSLREEPWRVDLGVADVEKNTLKGVAREAMIVGDEDTREISFTDFREIVQSDGDETVRVSHRLYERLPPWSFSYLELTEETAPFSVREADSSKVYALRPLSNQQIKVMWEGDASRQCRMSLPMSYEYER